MRTPIAYDFAETSGDKTIVHHVAYTQVTGDEAREGVLRHFPSGRDVVRERILAEMDRKGHTRAGLSAVSKNAPRGHEAGAVAAAGSLALQGTDKTPPQPRTPHAAVPRKYPASESVPMASGKADSVRSTSRDAYSKAKVSGKLTAQQSVVMRAFSDGGGSTRQELTARTGLGINAICGRVDELIKAGVLRETKRRACRITKENAMELEAVA